MTSNAFLPLFINEEVYLIKDSKTKKEPSFWGNNKQGILILVSNLTLTSLSSEEDEVLQKILLSVELTYDDVAIVNANKSNFEEIDFKKALCFGIPVQQQHNYYQVEEVKGKQWLLVDSLAEIAQDRSKKKKLWQHLQLLFPE
ncbi:MAG: DNA polymerase III subunit psi [Cyclobacteriaceae bacterium]